MKEIILSFSGEAGNSASIFAIAWVVFLLD
jgi:hypothetical protein